MSPRMEVDNKTYIQNDIISNTRLAKTKNAQLIQQKKATTRQDHNTNAFRDESVIHSIVTTCGLYYKPETQPTADRLRQEVYVATDENYGMEEAIEWAKGFEIPHSTVASDMKKISADGFRRVHFVREIFT